MAGMDHSAGSTGSAAAGGDSPLMASMNEMMQKMEASKPKGNTDHDFAHHMLEHHKGAVAMADIELRDGKDATSVLAGLFMLVLSIVALPAMLLIAGVF